MTSLAEKRGSNFTILVPFHKTALSETLLPMAVRAAKKYNGKIILLNIVEKPYMTSHNTAKKSVPEREALLSGGMELLSKAGSKCEMQVEISPDIFGAIEQVAKSKNVNLILMGSSGNENGIFSNEIPANLHQLDCSIVVARQQIKASPKSVWVFADQEEHILSMLDYGSCLLSAENGTLHLFFDLKQDSEIDDINILKEKIKTFKKNNPGFSGDIILGGNSKITGNSIDISALEINQTCIITPYPGSWLEQILSMPKNNSGPIAEANGLPIFMLKPESKGALA
jgi:nucleotide-binding universal stress UspA family protein